MRIRTHHVLVALLAIQAALAIDPVGSAPQDVAIVGVWQKAKCAGAVCGADDPKVSAGAAVAGIIQIQARARSSLGLAWVRVEARPQTGLFFCVRQWDLQGERNFSAPVDWDTYVWPSPKEGSGCSEQVPHFHGEPTANDIYALRVLAHETTTQTEAASQQFSVRFNNPPRPPAWSSPPVISGSGDSQQVRFSFATNREPDVVEYAVSRVDPVRATTNVVVYPRSSSELIRCERVQRGPIDCVDERYGSSQPEGTYTYRLIAYRRSGVAAASCQTQRVACIASQPSTAHSIRASGRGVAGGTPTAPASTPTQSATPIVQPSAIVQTPPAPSVPSEGGGAHIPSARAAEPLRSRQSRAVPITLAAAMIVATGAMMLRQRGRARA